MAAQLPIASYLFILRKHLLLVVGTVAIVLAGGGVFAATRENVFSSVAIVQIQSRAAGKADDRLPLAPVDQGFISDQVYLLKSDLELAERVVAHLQGRDPAKAPAPGSEGEGTTPGGGAMVPGKAAGPEEPPLPDPSRFKDLVPSRLLGRVSVTNIAPTTFYEFTVTGPDPEENYALANAYATVFAEVFREETQSRLRATVMEYQKRRDVRADDLARADEAIAAFKEKHKLLDLEAVTTGAARERLEALRKVLAEERSRLQVLKRAQADIEFTLRSVGLEIRTGPEGGATLHAVEEGSDGEAALLSERVQALDVVAANASVRKGLQGVEEADAEYRRMRTGSIRLLEDAEVVVQNRRQRLEHQRMVVRGTEAALLKHAQDVARTVGVVDDWTKQADDLEAAAAEETVARAQLERLRKAADQVRTEVDSLNALILETERQGKDREDETGVVRVKTYATEARAKQVAPNLPVIYAGTAALALLLAGALAYLLEFFDDTVKTREDFDRLVRLPFLGYVPHLKDGAIGDRDLVVARGKTGSPEVEAFRAIRTAIQFSRPDREVRVALVTSAGPGEGKTTVSINVATAFTGGRGKVLLVDADLRRARVHAALGVGNARGMTNVLVGEATLAEAAQASSVKGLDVLSSGPIPPNPAELLGSARMRELLEAASRDYDFVVVDSPPIVAVTDPALLANYVDAVFLVVSIGKTSIRTLQRAQEALSTVGAAIHGAILNNVDLRASGYAGAYGGYGYGYGYAAEGEAAAPAPDA